MCAEGHREVLPVLRTFASDPAQPLSGPHAIAAPEATERPRAEAQPATPEAVRQMLSATGWNVAKAARRLGGSRTTLYKRIAQLGIRRPAE